MSEVEPGKIIGGRIRYLFFLTTDQNFGIFKLKSGINKIYHMSYPLLISVGLRTLNPATKILLLYKNPIISTA